ncbi:hypothetical protein VKT23_004782 [Stygiomarasmius scandens]|uniref:Uncharacterized protein n=1 Tax=Marasmiellus scandens TaxID=2682957 RepID=A0ABR1JR77_9AGAR
MSLVQYNLRKMYKVNCTSDYLHLLSPEMWKFLRKMVLIQDASGANCCEKVLLAEYCQKHAEEKIAKDNVQREKHLAAEQAVNDTIPILTLMEFDYRSSLATRSAGYLLVKDIDLQLKWHLKNGVPGIVPVLIKDWGSHWEDKLKLLRTVIEKYVENGKGNEVASNEEISDNEDDVEVTVQDLVEFELDGYDSEEDYY